MYDPNQTGSVSESAVIRHLLGHDFNVSVPFNEVQYDLIIERGGALARVQVKTARLRGDDDKSVFCTLNSASRPSGTTYSENAFDILAMYSPDRDECYYALWENIGSSKFQVTTRDPSEIPRNAHRANLAKDYTIEEVIDRYV